MRLLVSLCLLLVVAFSQTPPTWPPHFQQDFVESYAKSTLRVIGKLYYDADRNASRLDRADGRIDGFCSSVLNISTPCIQLVNGGKRYLVYPNRRECCFCCDSSHGCGILKRDWLAPAKYLGKDELNGQIFDRFSIPDGDAIDYYWNTPQTNVPRKLAEADSIFKDFILNTYSENPIPDSIFAVPTYCGDQVCPDTTICGQLRSKTA